MSKISGRYYLSILALLAFIVLSTMASASGTSSDPGDLALGQSTAGTSSGWGMGSYPQQITDGIRFYEGYVGGVAFTGGYRPWWEPCGIRQAVVNFEGPKEFNKVIIWHHGSAHIPAICDLSYWDGSNWIDIPFTRDVDLSTRNWESDTLTFNTATGSKVKYSFDNCGDRYWIDPMYPNDYLIEHGWIYEFEVYLDASAPVNHPPVANNDDYSTAEDIVLTVPALEGILANDYDPDGDALSISSYGVPNKGILALNPDGSFTYTPEPNYHGTDSFAYTTSDGNERFDTATVTITVNPVNDAPVAADDAFTATEDVPLTISASELLSDGEGIDKDLDGDSLTISEFTQPGNGAITHNADGSFTYTPNDNYNGEDSFTYTISDGNEGTDTATVTITIQAVNDAPIAVGESVNTDENIALDGIDVLANDDDPDDDTLTIDSVTDPAFGTVEIKDNVINYRPNLWYSGEDSFQYTITDSTGLTASAIVTVTIEDTIPSPEDICASIQSLPNDAFKNDVDNRKTAFCNKLAEISNMIANKQYSDASDKLKNDILSKVDSDRPNAGWITDPVAQDELCNKVNTLLDALSVDWLPCV